MMLVGRANKVRPQGSAVWEKSTLKKLNVLCLCSVN